MSQNSSTELMLYVSNKRLKIKVHLTRRRKLVALLKLYSYLYLRVFGVCILASLSLSLSHDAMGWSVTCGCGISWPKSLSLYMFQVNYGVKYKCYVNS